MIVLARTPPPGWVRLTGDVQGVPLWKRDDEACYIATRDMDLLLFIDAALSRFDQMSGKDFHDFVTSPR